MFTTQCPKCQQTTEPIYKTAQDLPFDYEAGFFCQHCELERLDTDKILADLIATVNRINGIALAVQGATIRDGTAPPGGWPQPVGH